MAHIVMVYIYDKSINSNLLPSFNSGYINSCVIKDTDLGNNLIQREITNEEALPTSITMSNQPSLIEILECNATNCNHLSQSFYSNANLKRCKIQVGSEVHSLSHTLYSCSKLEYLDLSNSDFSSCTDTTNALNLNVIETLNLENVKFTNSTVDLIRRCSSSLSEINLDNVDTSLVTNMSGMFSRKVNLTELNLSSFDTSSVTNMSSMFSETLFDCLDLSNFNVSNVSNFEYMLKNCKNLKVFKLSQSKFPPNETEVTMGEMFRGCTSIEVLDLSSVKLKKIKAIGHAFYDMSSLKELNICNFRTNSDVSMSHVFYQAANLEILDVSNIDLSKTTDWHNAFINCAKLKHIGAMYCNAETINNIAKNLRSTATFYLNEEVGGLSVGNNSVIVKPYKSNILTVNEPVELRGIGDVQDTLNCLTGELTQRISEVTLNGETTANNYTSVDSYIGNYATHISKLVDGKNEKLYFQGFVGNIGNSKDYILTNGFAQYKGFRPNESELEEGLYRYSGSDHAYICISASRFTEHTFEGIKKFLSENPQSYLVTN